MSTSVVPACLYREETLAMTELQQQRLQVCENNWVRKIARLTRRAAELREEGRMTRGRPMLRWEACEKRDMRKAGEEEDWRNKKRDRRWKRLSDEAAEQLGAAPQTP